MIEIMLYKSLGLDSAGVPVSNITCLIYFNNGTHVIDLWDYELFK